MSLKSTGITSLSFLTTFLFMATMVCTVTNGQTKSVDQADQPNSSKSEPGHSDTNKTNQTSQKIESILTAQTKAWNEGDLDGFMKTYWNSPKLTFCSGGKTTRGWQETLRNYKTNYPTPKKMGKLHFDGLEVLMIESKSALVLGNWHLKMADDTKRDGNFSLVVKRLGEGWKIIHDHSSIMEADDSENPEITEDKN